MSRSLPAVVRTGWAGAGFAALCLTSALLFGCAAQKPAEIPPAPLAPPPPPGDLRIGISPDYPPLAMKQGGRLQGVEPEFAEGLAAELQRRTRLVELKWDELIPALRDGRIDIIMSGMSITADRQRLVNFAEPYLRIGQMSLIRKADLKKFADPASIDQKKTRIGFQNHTTGEDFVRDRMKNAILIGYNSIDKGVAALRKKKIDIFVHDAPTIWRVTGGFGSKEKQLTGRYELLTDEALAWAVRNEDADLRARLSDVVRKWKENGHIDQVLDHWILVRKTKVPE